MADYYVAQERAMAPGIAGEWPSVIPKPDSPHGRLVKLDTVPGMKDWQERVEGWAANRNLLLGSTPERQLTKLDEEFVELWNAIEDKCGSEEPVKDAIGDMCVVLCIIAKQSGLSFVDCLEHAWGEIKDRKGEMRNGIFVKEADL